MTDHETRILHVEDDPSLRNLVRIALERLGGFAVCTAADGAEALELARRHGADLVLLDLDLPGQDGVAVLRELRALPGLAGVPAVFLTAADAASRARVLEMADTEVLGKPFRPRALLDLVGRVLAEGR